MQIIRRNQWGAAPPKGTPVRVDWPVGVDLWVHHTAGPATQTPRQIQAFHQGPERGWNDIGYSYLIAPDGTVYEGRGFEVQAAHCPGHNHEPGVALIGDYSTKAPTDAQHRAVYDLRDQIQAGRLRGHREGFSTSCPGNAAMAKIVNGPPPKPPRIPLRERLIRGFLAAGFGPKSARQAADRYLRSKA